MERAVEWFVAVTAAVVGLSHLLRPGEWAETYRQLHRCGRLGAFANGALSLVPGAAVVAGHGSWAWPGGGADRVRVAADCQSGGVLPRTQQGAPVDGAGQSLAAGVRRRGAAALGGLWVDVLLPVAQGSRRRVKMVRVKMVKMVSVQNGMDLSSSPLPF
jgi:hypothetical protein